MLVPSINQGPTNFIPNERPEFDQLAAIAWWDEEKTLAAV